MNSYISLYRAVIMMLFSAIIVLTYSNYNYSKEIHQFKLSQQTYQQEHHLLLLDLQKFSQELYLTTQPYPCTLETEKLLGEHCDLGNYMEWALPELQEQTNTLLLHLKSEG